MKEFILKNANHGRKVQEGLSQPIVITAIAHIGTKKLSNAQRLALIWAEFASRW
jgi:hypothetical protein